MSGAAQVKQALQDKLSPQYIDIIDESHKHAGHAGAKGGGGHFVVHIVSDTFEGQSRMQRHRTINAATKHLFPKVIHALSIKAQTPQEAA